MILTHSYALLVGVNECNVPTWSLPDVSKDLIALETVLNHPQRCAYPQENIHVLTGKDATKNNIFAGLAWLKERLDSDPNDNTTALIYYSGHGWRDDSLSQPAYYLIPYDVSREKLRQTALRADDFAAEIASFSPRRLLILLDCCHAGGMGVKDVEMENLVPFTIPPAWLMGGQSSINLEDGGKDINTTLLSQGSGRAVLNSSRSTEKSYMRKDRKMSIFTYHLIEALTGYAPHRDEDKEVTVADVLSYVWRTVPQSAQNDHQCSQHPDGQLSGNFPIALLLGGEGAPVGKSLPDPLSELSRERTPNSHPVFDQSGQIVNDPQTNIAGDVNGSVFLNFNGPVQIDHRRFETGGGDHIERDKIDVYFNNGEKTENRNNFRNVYLHRLWSLSNRLPLSDLGTKENANPNLDKVYVALMTTTPEDDSKENFYSALELLNKHDYLVLLGEPGSGKTTFVNYVSACMCGHYLGKKESNLEKLKSPVFLLDDTDEGKRAQVWDQGALLPIRVILRDFVSGNFLKSGDTSELWDFIKSDLQKHFTGDIEKGINALQNEIFEKGGIILIDGLDEIPDTDVRKEKVKVFIENLVTSSLHERCKFLVTSRVYPYDKQGWKLNNFFETKLAPFTKKQISSFVDGWYDKKSIDQKNDMDEGGLKDDLKRAFEKSKNLLELARIPLLLTFIATLHSERRGNLPDQRELLYHETVKYLLEKWENSKTIKSSTGSLKFQQPSLTEYLKVDEKQKILDVLCELAYKAHALQLKENDTADIARSDLIDRLLDIAGRNSDINPKKLMEYLSERTGLLIPRADNLFTFPHRTFQEYLAACYLTDHSFPEKVAELSLENPERWREVAVLAGAKAARGARASIWNLVDALINLTSEDNVPDTNSHNQKMWAALIASQALSEVGQLAIPKNPTSDSQIIIHSKKREQLLERLMILFKNEGFSLLERARSGKYIAQLGDPRFDKLYANLPKDEMFGFIHISSGEFVSKSDNKKYEIPEFWIGKYLVTVEQFNEYDSELNRVEKHYGVDKDGSKKLYNHPVRWIEEEHALGYCKWLENRLREYSIEKLQKSGRSMDSTCRKFYEGLSSQSLHVGLPSVIEWEKAASGPYANTFPWESMADPNSVANFNKTGIDEPTSVGLFPSGPYGLYDMGGNVWEWTRSYIDPRYESPKVICGGSYAEGYDSALCCSRDHSVGGQHALRHCGFRVIVSENV